MNLPNILFPVFMFPFIFHCRSFSPCWPLLAAWALAFLCFSSYENRLLYFQWLALALSLLKNNAEKDTTLLLFFLSKSPGAHVISFQIKPWVLFGLPYLLIELFFTLACLWRSLARCTVTWLPNKFSEMGRLPHFLCYEPQSKLAGQRLTIPDTDWNIS